MVGRTAVLRAVSKAGEMVEMKVVYLDYLMVVAKVAK